MCGVAIGMLIYWLMDRKPWPITARLAGGVSGAALGTFAAGVGLLPYHLGGLTSGIVAVLLASEG